MLRSRTKSRLFVAGIILLAVFIVLIGCNLVLNFQKNRISQAASRYFTQKVLVDSLLYLPPGFVFLKNISMSEFLSGTGKNIFVMPLVMAKFSLFRFVKSGKIVFTDICVYDFQGEYPVLRDFVKDNFKAIWNFFLDLPHQDIRVMAKDSKVSFSRANGESGWINSRFFLKMKNNIFSGYGSTSRNLENKLPGLPTDFIFKGSLNNDSAVFDNIEIMRENIYAKFWGRLSGALLKLNGFTFVNTEFKEYAYSEPFLTAKENLENFLRGFPGPPRSPEMPKTDLFLLDLEAQIAFNFPEIDIQSLKFALNNNPMSLSGKITLGWNKPVLLDLNYSATLSQLKNWANDNPSLKRINVALKGNFENRVFKGRSHVSFDFLNRKKENLPLEEFIAGFDDLSVSFQKYPRVTASVKNADIFCRTDSSKYRVDLQYLGMDWDLRSAKVKSCKFSSQFYDGKLKGRVWLNLAQAMPRITAYLRIKDAASNKMDNILEHFSKVHGRLSGQMRFTNFPALKLKGALTVNNGYIENFEFLKWLSGFFNLDSLEKIGFARAKSNFSVDSEGAGIKDLSLASKSLSMGGAFHLGADNMVTSKLALTCNRDLLSRSAKFKPLMGLVGKDVEALTFEFRLSGNLHHMNFLWLESDFKNRLRKAIPGFMERSLEKKIEESLQPLAQ